MAKFFKSKGRRRAVTALSVFLAASLTMGAIAACTTTTDTDTDEETESATLPADTQLIKNGNFEFYDEVVKENVKEKKNLISTPNSWTFTSGSPSSSTLSGIINTQEWDYLTKSISELTSIDDAVARWNDVSAYDRLKFYEDHKDEIAELESGSEAKKLFDEYSFRIDFEDVEDLHSITDETDGKFALHPGVKTDDDGNPTETSVLMIHNQRAESNENVIGTAQYYTSSTTITLESGTAAELSVWVRTDRLFHYTNPTNKEDGYLPVERNAGAYIGVTHTVGGTTLDEMQIKNINTNGEWEQYTLYIRASSYATSTFRIKLGLGLGSSEDRYESVNGYAFFDDLECTRISGAEFNEKTSKDVLADNHKCGIFSTINDDVNEKVFKMDALKAAEDTSRTFALDMDGAEKYDPYGIATPDIHLTVEQSGRRTYTSEDKGFPDTSIDDASNTVEAYKRNIAKVTTMNAIKQDVEDNVNGYLNTIYEEDFKDKYPFDGDEKMILLLSANGAAYTAELAKITLPAKTNMLISFWVKTYDIASGKSGAGATLVDGENKTSISPFNTHSVAAVDLDPNAKGDDAETKKDINKGWVQCFFFVTNETDYQKEFHIELTYGPVSIAGSTATDYAGGYAAFTKFEKIDNFSKTLLSYAPTNGDRAKTVSLTGYVDPVTRFDTVKAGEDIEHELSLPTNFTGVVSGSRFVDSTVAPDSEKNEPDEGLYTGLLSREYATNYANLEDDANIKGDEVALAARKAWKGVLGVTAATADTSDTDRKNSTAWWTSTFGTASQPLVVINTSGEDIRSYGFYTSDSTISANSYQKIAVRVKLSPNANAYVYLADRSDLKQGTKMLSTNLPALTYWYDDEGNVTSMDPTDKDFNAKTDILYYLEENGLYTKKGESNGKYYANLTNYKAENGNLVTKNGTVAFYGKDGKYYADEACTVAVENFPKDTPARYDYSETAAKTSVIKVEGNGSTVSEWVEVAFYVHTGNEAKTYRLEVWAGARSGDDATIPAGEYVMFDNYRSSSASDYNALQSEAVEALKLKHNEGKQPGDEGYLGADDNLPADIALYYTFTFFDSDTYLRYDKTEDEEERGNPWQDYLQSAYSEQLVYLYCADPDGTLLGVDGPMYEFFLDYSAVEVEVQEADLDVEEEEDIDEDSDSDVNVWLLISSGVLAAVLIFAVFAVAVRMVLKKLRKSGKLKPKAEKAPKAKRVKPEAKHEETSAPEPEAPKSKQPDENDPYNE